MMTRHRLPAILGLVLGGLAAGACAAAAQEVVAGEWSPYAGGPDSVCADGSDPTFLERPADRTRVVLYLEGGGACFDASTCAFDGPDSSYVSSSAYVPALMAHRGGIFDDDRADNPVAGHSFVYVPYCTGDVHLGTSSHRYGADLVVEHKGFFNAAAGLDHLAAAYPEAREVVIAGSSAGSIPTPLLGALAADRLPGARVVTLGDSSGAYPDDPVVNAYLGTLWGTAGAVPDWPETQGLSIDEWSAPALYAFAARHAPDVTYGRFDYASDSSQAVYGRLVGFDTDELLLLIEQNEAEAEAAGARIVSYVAPGDAHTILGSDAFYELTVGGVRFRDWFADLVGGDTPPDVP